MPRTVPANVLTAINSDSFALPTLGLIKLAGGTTIALTDWDVPLAVDLLGEGVENFSPYLLQELSAFAAQVNAPIDDRDLKIILGGVTLTADDIRRGRLDNATIFTGYVVPTDLAHPWYYCTYDIGQTGIDGLVSRLEMLGPEKRLETPVGRSLTADCPHTYGGLDCGIPTRADVWAATTAYALGALVKRLTGTGIFWFKATVAGTGGLTEPTWPTVLGNTVVDGTVTWKAIRARRLIGTVTASADRRTITAAGVSVVSDYFGEGELTFLTGNNAGDTRRVRSDDGSGHLGLHIGAYDDIAVGDTFEVLVGCRHRRVDDCITKHDNQHNSRTLTLRFGGTDFLAGENVTATAPKA